MFTHYHGWISLVLCGWCLWLLRPGWRRLAGTTLRAAWCWGALAIGVLVAVEATLGFRGTHETPEAEYFRFAAAVLTFSPVMALLGAKRPQNGAWQFVVFTLWGLLALSAVEVWLRGRGEPLDIDVVRSWFLVVLVTAGWVNHLPTRFGWAACFFAAGQMALLWTHLPFGGRVDAARVARIGMALLLLALVAVQSRAKAPATRSVVASIDETLGRWNVVWHDFRDWFGAVWSLRVMERINASSRMYGWSVVLGWDGFQRTTADVSTGDAAPLTIAEQTAVEQALRTLLRRFVSPEWMEGRLRGDIPE
jgi:hypothetical protein